MPDEVGAARALARGFAKDKKARERSEATADDVDAARALRKIGLNTSADEVAFTRLWELAGWAPTRNRADALAAELQGSSESALRTDGDDASGWSIYRRRAQ